MTRFRICLAGAAMALALAACTQYPVSRPQTAAGVLAFDDVLPGGPVVVLRVQNDYATPIRVYAEANEDTNVVANVGAGETQTVTLGTRFFRFALTTFAIRPVSDTVSTLLGPYSLNRGDRVRIVVAQNLDSSHVFQNGNW
jgi:hypothetical protein